MEASVIFENELRKTGRLGVERVIESIRKTDFYSCQCYGHDRYRGGTLNHSLWTLFIARKTLANHPDRYPGVQDDSLTLVCLLHDLGDIRRGYTGAVRYAGRHGKKSAEQIRAYRDKYGFDIKEEELAAIRFHRGSHISDSFDQRLAPYQNTPFIRLLKNSDHKAAGVMNNIRFGEEVKDTLSTREPNIVHLMFNPAANHWYLDTMGRPMPSYPTRQGDIDPKSLTKTMDAELVYGILLYHISDYDLLVARNRDGGLAILTVVSATMGEGDFYRTDRGGFGYKTVVVYNNRYRPRGLSESSSFVLTENKSGLWSVIDLHCGQIHDDSSSVSSYHEFIERTRKVAGCTSEAEALREFRHIKHGIDLSDRDYYERVVVR